MPRRDDRPSVPERLSTSVRGFLETEAAGGVVLLVAAAIALVWANSPLHEAYDDLWHTEARVGIGDASLSLDLRHWVNDAAMALFFFVVGLEVKRELVLGELRRWRTAALPTIAAVGGMIVPAALYAVVNASRAGSDGWGVPMATDIAFAVGVLVVLGSRVPPSLKLFLLTLAVADDIGAIVVIAAFYGGDLDLVWLVYAAGLLVAMAALRRVRVRAAVLVLLGLGVWLATYNAGLHATIAGVVLGLLVPAREVEHVEERLHPWTSFAVVPLFALANAGVRLADTSLSDGDAFAVAGGIVLGLVVGKFVGIVGFSWLAVRLGVGELPAGVGWLHLAGAAACAGIGFTVSLFVAGLAFDDEALIGAAKVGILVGSLVAAVVGAALIAAAGRAAADQTPKRAR